MKNIFLHAYKSQLNTKVFRIANRYRSIMIEFYGTTSECTDDDYTILFDK